VIERLATHDERRSKDAHVKTFDVAIIGGGLIGASIAFELAGAKLHVGVFDRQEPGREASRAAAGMLSPAPDSLRDLPLVPLGRESLDLYPEFVGSIETESSQSTGYAREGTLEVFTGTNGERDRDHRITECRRLGLRADQLTLDTAKQWEPGVCSGARAVAWLPDEGTVEPRSLTGAVIAAARNRNIEFRGNCPVTSLTREGNRCTGFVAGGEEIFTAHVVLAAGCFSSQIAAESGFLARYAPTRPVRGQMMALRTDGPGLRRVLRSERGYLVPRPDGRIIAGSTSEDAGFDKNVTPEGLRKIFDAALELFPGLANADVIETWSGLRPGTPDDLPILGPTDIEGLLVATGHYRNGILLAPVTAKLVREWIIDGRTTFDAEAFSPLRFGRQKTQAGAVG
jgi:glycine oxidase